MTVAHPPPMPPLFVEPSMLTAPLDPAGLVTRRLRLYIHLHGFESLDPQAVEAVLRQALTPEGLVLGLSQLVHASGMPLAQVHFTAISGHLHLLLKEHPYGGVDGDETLSRFFAGRTGQNSLTLRSSKKSGCWPQPTASGPTNS